MATAIIRPNEDTVPNDWTTSGFGNIDDDVTNPATDWDANVVVALQADAGEYEYWGFGDVPSDVITITSITVYAAGVRGLTGGGGTMSWTVDEPGGYSSTKALSAGFPNAPSPSAWGTPQTWSSLSLTQAEGNVLQLRCVYGGVSKGSYQLVIEVLYILITYTPAVTGWAHKWNGMTPDKFLGMDMLNSKILGIG